MIHNKEYAATMEGLQAEIDALKAKVFIIHSAARFVVYADAGEGYDYHLAGLERALNLNQNECPAQVKHDAIVDFKEWSFSSGRVHTDKVLGVYVNLTEGDFTRYSDDLLTQEQDNV